MKTIEVNKSTKERLKRLGGGSSPDKTIRTLLERSNRLNRIEKAIAIRNKLLDKYFNATMKIEALMEELNKQHDKTLAALMKLAVESEKRKI